MDTCVNLWAASIESSYSVALAAGSKKKTKPFLALMYWNKTKPLQCRYRLIPLINLINQGGAVHFVVKQPRIASTMVPQT